MMLNVGTALSDYKSGHSYHPRPSGYKSNVDSQENVIHQKKKNIGFKPFWICLFVKWDETTHRSV